MDAPIKLTLTFRGQSTRDLITALDEATHKVNEIHKKTRRQDMWFSGGHWSCKAIYTNKDAD